MRSKSSSWVAAVVVGLAACAMNQTPGSVQRKVLDKQLPSRFEVTRTWDGEPRTAKVRVLADIGYRRQHTRWRDTIDLELDAVNELFVPMLGVRLEPSYEAWDYEGGANLNADIAALAALAPNDPAVWVVGFTDALSLVEARFDTLGVATPGYAVVRGYADLEERAQYERAFTALSRDELEAVHDARRRHKSTAVLVHELAHAVGAIHEDDPTWIMSPVYSPKVTHLSDRNRALMLIGIADRLKPVDERDPAATARSMVAAIEASPWPAWVEDERQQTIAELEVVASQGTATRVASPVPIGARDQYAEAQRLAAENKHDDALAALKPIIAAYPADAKIRLLACEIELARAPASPDAKATCERAAELAPGDPAIYLTIATTRSNAGDRGGARDALVAAEARVANLKTAAGETWAQIAEIYQRMGVIAWAEDAVTRGGLAPDHAIARWIRTTRARYGVPRDGANVTPETERDAVAAVRGILDQVYASKLPAARKAARDADKRWPGLPGIAAARCDLELRGGSVAAARRACDAAIAAGDASSWARYLMGIIELRATSKRAHAAGVAHLRRAIALDPELTQAWRALEKALERAGDTAGLAEVKQQYKQLFGGR